MEYSRLKIQRYGKNQVSTVPHGHGQMADRGMIRLGIILGVPDLVIKFLNIVFLTPCPYRCAAFRIS